MSTSSREFEQLMLFERRSEAVEKPKPSHLIDLESQDIAHREIGRFHRFRVFLVDTVQYTGFDWLCVIRPKNTIITHHEVHHWSALVRVARHYRRFGEPTTLLERFAEKRNLLLMDAADSILGPVDLIMSNDQPMSRQLYHCLHGVFFDFLHQNEDAGYNWVGYDIVTRF